MTSVLLPVNVLSLGQQYKDYAKENPSKPKRGRRVKKKEALKKKYTTTRKAQNIEAPESLQSVFMKEVRPMFKANLQKIKKEHTSGVPTFKSVRKAQRKSAIATTQSQIKKNPSLNKAMKKLKKQKNID